MTPAMPRAILNMGQYAGVQLCSLNLLELYKSVSIGDDADQSTSQPTMFWKLTPN